MSGEIKTPPVKLTIDGEEYDCFHKENHSLSDIARWICDNKVDAEELIRCIQEELKNNEE